MRMRKVRMILCNDYVNTMPTPAQTLRKGGKHKFGPTPE